MKFVLNKDLISATMKCLFVLFLFAIAVEGASKGDTCTKDGASGVCTNLRDCPAAIEDITNKKKPQICELSGLDPTVCCVPSATATKHHSSRKRRQSSISFPAEKQCEPIHPSLTSKPTGQKAWDKCLEYQGKLVFPCGKSQALFGGYTRSNRCHHNADELIIGGKSAAQYEFPHMALLAYGDDPNNLQWLCGGTLISENFILTAGHCTVSRFGNVSYVQLGTLRRSSMPAKSRFRVKNIIKHPEYASPILYHDIALLELETPVPLDEFIVPACVHTGAPVNDSKASVTGWGHTSNRGQLSDDLQKVILTKFDGLECAITYKPHRFMKQGLDERSQICFGDRTKSSDTCQGDSGGPLQIKSKEIACMYTILGVTSFGSECGIVGLPGVYTRVANYVDWIEKTVWP